MALLQTTAGKGRESKRNLTWNRRTSLAIFDTHLIELRHSDPDEIPIIVGC